MDTQPWHSGAFIIHILTSFRIEVVGIQWILEHGGGAFILLADNLASVCKINKKNKKKKQLEISNKSQQNYNFKFEMSKTSKSLGFQNPVFISTTKKLVEFANNKDIHRYLTDRHIYSMYTQQQAYRYKNETN